MVAPTNRKRAKHYFYYTNPMFSVMLSKRSAAETSRGSVALNDGVILFVIIKTGDQWSPLQ